MILVFTGVVGHCFAISFISQLEMLYYEVITSNATDGIGTQNYELVVTPQRQAISVCVIGFGREMKIMKLR